MIFKEMNVNKGFNDATLKFINKSEVYDTSQVNYCRVMICKLILQGNSLPSRYKGDLFSFKYFCASAIFLLSLITSYLY